jgi:DNA-binding NtrC family response regulator
MVSKEKGTLVSKPKGRGARARRRGPTAALLVASSPAALELGVGDRTAVEAQLTVGRGEQCDFTVDDRRISQLHFSIRAEGRRFLLEDLGSTNGTSVNGRTVARDERRALTSPAIVRAGETVFVFEAIGDELLDVSTLEEGHAVGMVGAFHAGAMLAQLREVAFSERPPLLDGPSGAGKELAAAALARFWKLEPPRRYNVSAATSPEEMSRALFGVASGAYTGVEKQDGLIVTASKLGQPLFLDEVHHLPVEAQATLLTVIEDKRFSRKGAEHKELEVDVRFIFASNEPEKLKADLRARTWQVRVPSLRERVADAPTIFDHLIAKNLSRHGIELEPVMSVLDGEFYHDLCLEVLQGERFASTNVRGLVDLADRITSRVAAGANPVDAVDSICEQCMTGVQAAADAAGSGTGHYEENRELISALFIGCGKNVKKTVDMLKKSGVPWTISRRHLIKHLVQWGLKNGD